MREAVAVEDHGPVVQILRSDQFVTVERSGSNDYDHGSIRRWGRRRSRHLRARKDGVSPAIVGMRGVREVPRYRYQRVDDPDPVEIVAAAFELAPSGMATFYEVVEENGMPLRRQVDTRHVRVAGGEIEELPETALRHQHGLSHEADVDVHEIVLRLEGLVQARRRSA